MRLLGAFQIATVVISVIILVSCSGADSMLPRSGGRAYEVVVTSASRECAVLMDSILSQDTPALPQSEPMFDVSRVDSVHFGQTARLARAIVMVTADSTRFTATRIRYEKNVWAKPQMVVYVNTPDVSVLRRDIPKIARSVISLLVRAELNMEIVLLAHSYNKEAAATVKSMFGADMRIPADMKASKRGHNFVWFSNNTAGGMRNICVYSYTGGNLMPERALTVRDSVMKINIPGERQGMYMQTAEGSVKWSMTQGGKSRYVMVGRGLWEMHGDAMGGPFVSHLMTDTSGGRVLVAEAFVYAPETRKRNLIRQLEAALFTLKLDNENKK